MLAKLVRRQHVTSRYMYLSPLATARPKFGLAHDSHARGRPPFCRAEAGSRLGCPLYKSEATKLSPIRTRSNSYCVHAAVGDAPAFSFALSALDRCGADAHRG